MLETALDAAEVAPVLDEALGLAEEALMAQQDIQQKVAAKDREVEALKRQLVDQEKVILEKVAKQQILNPVELDRLLDRFEDLHVMSAKERTKISAHVQRDPNLLFPLFSKAADLLSRAPGEGMGISADDSALARRMDDDDPDGWNAAAAGKAVAIKP